jgi:hypothetical protein
MAVIPQSPVSALAEVRHEQHDLDVLLLFFSRN